MWKWLGGCLVLLVVLVIAGSWWGYNAMKSNLSPDGTDTVAIAASPARVFASLANGDSVSQWMAQGNTIMVRRRGRFVVGDSLQIGLRSGFGMPRRPMTWRVTQIVPDQVIAMELLGDSTHRVVAIRRDSLVAAGDSTRIVSTVASPLMDSVQTARERTGKSGGVLGISSDLIVSAFRMQSKLDLLRLKERIEGKPAKRR